MVYVDLNLIRAGLAHTPEGSDFTSIQERLRVWQEERITPSVAPRVEDSQTLFPDECFELPGSIVESGGPRSASPSFLCPIQSDSKRRGILEMTAAQYFDLVDRSGRLVRMDKRGAMDPELEPILIRMGVCPTEWISTISQFGSRFQLAAGLIASLRSFADHIGQRWIRGIAAASVAFAS